MHSTSAFDEALTRVKTMVRVAANTSAWLAEQSRRHPLQPGGGRIHHVVREAYPGAIVLMHNGDGDRSQSVAAVETILKELSGQGYVFRTAFVP